MLLLDEDDYAALGFNSGKHTEDYAALLLERHNWRVAQRRALRPEREPKEKVVRKYPYKYRPQTPAQRRAKKKYKASQKGQVAEGKYKASDKARASRQRRHKKVDRELRNARDREATAARKKLQQSEKYRKAQEWILELTRMKGTK